MHLRPEHLVGGAEGDGAHVLRTAQRRRQVAQAVDAENLDLREVLHQPLANQRIVDRAVGARGFDEQAVLLLEPAVSGGGRLAAFEGEGRVGHLPAVVDPTHHVVGRASGIGEEHLAELGGPVRLGDAAHLDTVLAHRNEQIGDAGVLWRRLIGAGEQEAVVGMVTLGGPHLLAVDHPFITIEHRGGLETRQVRTRVRLGEPLAPAGLTLQDAGEELALLLLGSPLQQRRADQGVAEEVAPHGSACASELLGEDDPLHGAETLAAVLGRPGGADPPTREQLGGPLGVELAALLVGHLEAGFEPPGGEVLLEPSPDLGPELLGVGGIREVHGLSLPPSTPPRRIDVALPRRNTPFTLRQHAGHPVRRGSGHVAARSCRDTPRV